MIINIIDPTSAEFNRGSFCYAPYLSYNYLKEEGHDVTLYESFRAEDIDTLREAELNIVCLWSYPQIETASILYHLLPAQTGKDNVEFIGYSDLIKHLGFPHSSRTLGFDILKNAGALRTAMLAYPKYYSHFRNLLLSDCDMHLQHLEKNELVYPLFTTYGCPNRCTFCPSTINCAYERSELTVAETKDVLDACLSQGIRNIHFTDEDFFYDAERVYAILSGLKGKGMHLIALGAADAVYSFIEKYGTDVIKEAGLEVIEIGFESGSTSMSKTMGQGKDLDKCSLLAARQHDYPFSIFWLVLTFYVGETIATLNATGRFMRKYGFKMSEVVGRLRTNGTKGGLGQFFQAYHGSGAYRIAQKNGRFITERAVRLTPSYIPDSFLDSVIREIDKTNYEEALKWVKLYNITEEYIEGKRIKKNTVIRDYLPKDENMIETIKVCTMFAVLARWEVIK